MRSNLCILCDPRRLEKFCAALNRNYRCQAVGLCKKCPLALAGGLLQDTGVCVVEDFRALRKFCEITDKNLGCKAAFGTSRDNYGTCKSCPLATAIEVVHLMTLKSMTMGEAVKQSYRGPVSAQEAFEILAAYARGERRNRPYPEPEGGE